MTVVSRLFLITSVVTFTCGLACAVNLLHSLWISKMWRLSRVVPVMIAASLSAAKITALMEGTSQGYAARQGHNGSALQSTSGGNPKEPGIHLLVRLRTRL